MALALTGPRCIWILHPVFDIPSQFPAYPHIGRECSRMLEVVVTVREGWRTREGRKDFS